MKKLTKQEVNILFTCIGRRVSLAQRFRQASKSLKLEPCIIGADKTQLSPALQLCDKGFVVKPVSNNGYLDELLNIVKTQNIDLLVPTVDLDLKIIALNKEKLKALGCRVLISTPDVIDICQDKRKTYMFLKENGFDTPETVELDTALSTSDLSFPRFLKPWDGYASRGNAVVNNLTELEVIGKRIPNCIVQENIPGKEYTCDAYVDSNHQVRCVVPRERIEVRSGEVSKGQTHNNLRIMNAVKEVVEVLGAGPGVITIQLITNGDAKIKFIEINPRFGGGAPLSIEAGADFPKWILQEMIGTEPNIQFDGFKDNLTMLRYDAEVWF